MLGIGIDTGGTCTDAVIYDFDRKEVLASGKAQTTKQNLEIGIANALDTLPEDLIASAEMISLSTTLATNACVENKGVRAKLLMIGFDESLMDHLKEIYASYGLTDSSQFVILDAKVEGLYSQPFDPDWEDLRRRASEYFGDCDSVGIVQKHPKANGGRMELTALKILSEELDVPLTISFEISNETDILKTCAGTLLNARLIPLISEFMEAVHNVMTARGLNIPISIIRSDGTMMSEDMAKKNPVETILCGPAASVVGGSESARGGDAVIVDMGGTTTDIAIVRAGVPETAKDGIMIGGWKTMVKGLYVETVGLGGDSAVRYKDGKLFLDTVRVIPLSVLASEYDHVARELRDLSRKARVNSSWDHEYYVLLKDITGKTGYTPFETAVCEALQERPLNTLDLAEIVGRYPRFLSTDRLERDGIIIKSGLTPTDMMILKGDFTLYDGAAAEAAIECLAPNIYDNVKDVPDIVYDLVCRKMYHTLTFLLMKQQYPGVKAFTDPEVLAPMLDAFYEQAKARIKGDQAVGGHDADISFVTHFPLVGVGAPIHVFLPRVAELLGTESVIPVHAGVANALGAVTSRRIARSEQIVKAEYENGALIGFTVACDGKRHVFNEDEKEKAIALGRESILRGIREKAKQLGIKDEPKITLEMRDKRLYNSQQGILLEVLLSATAEEDTELPSDKFVRLPWSEGKL